MSPEDKEFIDAWEAIRESGDEFIAAGNAWHAAGGFNRKRPAKVLVFVPKWNCTAMVVGKSEELRTYGTKELVGYKNYTVIRSDNSEMCEIDMSECEVVV